MNPHLGMNLYPGVYYDLTKEGRRLASQLHKEMRDAER